jgi:hypothetical protein
MLFPYHSRARGQGILPSVRRLGIPSAHNCDTRATDNRNRRAASERVSHRLCFFFGFAFIFSSASLV